METGKLPEYDIWQKDTSIERLPSGAIHACSYELNLGADRVLELLFLNRFQEVDELWSVTTFSERLLEEVDGDTRAFGVENPLVFTVGRPLCTASVGSPAESCKVMLDLLFQARFGFNWPERFRRAGIIDEAEYDNIVNEIDSRVKTTSRETASNIPQLVFTARRLGLRPRPSGTHVGQWVANCPGTSHPIWISASTNEFTCPWCRRKGGPEELRTFAAQRHRR
jgi:hypothetical protein